MAAAATAESSTSSASPDHQPSATTGSASAPNQHPSSHPLRARLGSARKPSQGANVSSDRPQRAPTAPEQHNAEAQKQREVPSDGSASQLPRSSSPLKEGHKEAASDNRASGSIEPHIRFIVTSILATSTSVLILSNFHWTLALLSIIIGCHVTYTKLVSKDADDTFRLKSELRKQLLENKSNEETVEWMNSLLASMWPLINADLFTPFIDLLEDALQLQVPGIVHAVRVEDLDQGVVPLVIDSLKVLPSDENAFLGKGADHDKKGDKEEAIAAEDPRDQIDVDLGDHINLEVSFSYRATASSRKGFTTKSHSETEEESHPRSKQTAAMYDRMGADAPAETIHLLLYLAIGLQKIAAVEMPVWVSVVGIAGKMRLRLQLVPALPFIKHVGFTLIEQPKIELKAKPLGRSMVIDAMNLPLLSSYVLRSIQTTVQPFISPASYTIDVAGILGAGDGPRNSYAVGVISVIVHYADDLPAADANGLADPFVTLSFARAGKPLFRTRVLRRNKNPRWNEVAYLLVGPDEIRDHDRLRFTIFDADRFSADDPLGKVEVSIDRLIQESLARDTDFNSCSLMETRTVPLEPMKKGWEVQGTFKYSIAFCRLVQQEGLDAPMATPHRSKLIHKAAQRGFAAGSPVQGRDQDQDQYEAEDKMGRGGSVPIPAGGLESSAKGADTTETSQLHRYETGFDRFVRQLGLPIDRTVLEARAARHARVTKLLNVLSGEEAAVASPPSRNWPSGILSFHVHAIHGLEVGRTQKSLSSKGASLFAAGSVNNQGASGSGDGESSGLEGAITRLPSSYVQIILNDEAVLSTRVKTLNNRPFFNAGSERFVTDFPTSRISFIVRDRRQRENDPILGIVDLKLSHALKHSARWSGWHTIEGGLGVGKMRVTLVWRSVHVCIPRPLRGSNVGILEIGSLRADLSLEGTNDLGPSRSILYGQEAHWLMDGRWGRRKTESFKPSVSTEDDLTYETVFGKAGSSVTAESSTPSTDPMRLPLSGRYPASMIITLKATARSTSRQRKRIMACINLERCLTDGRITELKVPLYATGDSTAVEEAARRGAGDYCPEELKTKVSAGDVDTGADKTSTHRYRHAALKSLVAAPLYPPLRQGPGIRAGQTQAADESYSEASSDDEPEAAARSSMDASKAADASTSSRLRLPRTGHARTGSISSMLSNRSRKGQRPSEGRLQAIGFLTIQLAFFPGLAEEHRAILSGDHALRFAFEAWTCARDAGIRHRPHTFAEARKKKEKQGAQQRERQQKDKCSWDTDTDGEAHGDARPGAVDLLRTKGSLSSLSSSSSFSGTDSSAFGGGRQNETAVLMSQSKRRRGSRRPASSEAKQGGGPSDPKLGNEAPAREGSDDDDNDGDEGDEYDRPSRRTYRRQLHRQEAGAAQFKTFRTMTWLKQNLDDGWGRIKRHTAPMGRGGANVEAERRRVEKMEREGISSF